MLRRTGKDRTRPGRYPGPTPCSRGDGSRNRSTGRRPTCATREGHSENPPSRPTLTSDVGTDLLFCLTSPLASSCCPCPHSQVRLAVRGDCFGPAALAMTGAGSRLAMTKTGPPHPEPRAELGFRATPCPLPLRGGEGNKVDLPDEAFDWNQALCYRIYSEEETF